MPNTAKKTTKIPKKISLKATKNPSAKSTSPAHPMDALLAKQTITSIKKGQEVDARIEGISKKEEVFDIGAKANAALGDREKRKRRRGGGNVRRVWEGRRIY